jgi:glycosyltransferase involved in cell wall biosynthesis
MTRPSVAVVIPSCNHGRFIAATLESVFRQTRPPQEVHVIDDGSTDDSVAVIERAFAGAGAIRCFLTVRENRGISATRNDLSAATTTDFVAFLDSDDLYAPTRLERLLANAPRRAPFLAFSGVDFMGDAPEDLRRWHTVYRLKLEEGMSLPTAGFALLRSNIAISASNFVVSRALLDAVGGFDNRIKICQDWDFAVRALRFVEPTFVPEPLLRYHLHAQNTSRQWQGTWEVDLVVDKLCEWILGRTDNPLAPTPHNWPRYFRIFARLNTGDAGRALAARLPWPSLAGACGVAPSKDTAAIRRLIAASQAGASVEELPLHALMRACGEAWGGRP